MPVSKVDVVEDEYTDDKLDDWYSDDDEDQSAAEAGEVQEDSSPPVTDPVTVPDTEVQTPDGVTTPEGDGSQSEPQYQGEDPLAWIDQLDPELKRQAEALVNRDKSNSGRVAALQSRLDEQQAALDAQQVAARDRRQQAVEARDEESKDEGLQEFEKEFPTVSGNVDKMVELKLAKEREALMNEIRPLKEEAARDRIAGEKSALRETVSRLFNTAETGIQLEDVTSSVAWKDWLDAQPEGYRQYALKATSAQDAGKVLGDFAAYADDRMHDQWQRDQLEAEESSTGEADRLAARRESALSGSTPRSQSATIDDGNSGDYESYFDHFVAEDG